MKNSNKLAQIFCGMLLILLMSRCAKENEDYIYIHDNNLISQMICKSSHTGGEFRGVIHEYNSEGERMTSSFTKEDVHNGYGLILIPVSKSLEKDVDLSNVYLRATISYDAMITPSLSGRHDITGEGIIITVESGERTKRQYRVRGYYE